LTVRLLPKRQSNIVAGGDVVGGDLINNKAIECLQWRRKYEAEHREVESLTEDIGFIAHCLMDHKLELCKGKDGCGVRKLEECTLQEEKKPEEYSCTLFGCTGTLSWISDVEGHTCPYYICDKCDSTFTKRQVEEGV
jgi:hypothetical protein